MQLRNPRREVEVTGPISVSTLLNRLEVPRESVLVIRSGTLVPGDGMLDDTDVVEIRPVISGGGTDLTGSYPAPAMPRGERS